MGGVGQFNEYNVFIPGRSRPVVKVALVHPSTYQASITNLFTHIAYYYIYNRLGVNKVLVDRFTLDNVCEGAVTGLPLSRFDIALVTVAFELDIINFIKFLIDNRINPFKKKRVKGPILIAGGPALMANPEPVIDLVDAIFIGDGEAFLKTLADTIETCNGDKQCVLMNLRDVKDGIYLGGGGGNVVRKSIISNLDDAFFPTYQIRPETIRPVYGDGFYVESSRGCKWLCPFCLESYISYPPRHRSMSKLKRLIEEGTSNLRVRRTVLYSLSFFDHPNSVELLEWLHSNNYGFSLPSVRFDTLSRKKIDLIALGGQRTVTVAPETPCPELSCRLHKCFKLEDLLDLCTYVIEKKLNLKLYFMLGIPGEERPEEKIVEFIRNMISRARPARREQIRVTINPLIPKAHTPFQYFPLISKSEYEQKITFLRNTLNPLGVRVNVYGWRWAFAQALIGLAGRDISKLLVTWALKGGGLASLKTVIREVDYDFSYVFKYKNLNYEFSWNKVVLGLEDVIESEASAFLQIISGHTR
ncbi:MAG: radical SAM protein [Desulfurococcales archaeon]|nr:radical SAM protein [Desulfurococcales archaeon]